jgi:hypothetical protein
MLNKKIIAFIIATLISSITFAQATENTQWFRLVTVNNNQAEFEKIWQASQSRMANVYKATIQGKEVIVSGPFTYQKAQEMQQRFIEKGITNVQFLRRDQINITQQGQQPNNPSTGASPQNNNQAVSYGEKNSLPKPLNEVKDLREHVAACVATAFAFEISSKGTMYDTRDARIWAGQALNGLDDNPEFNTLLRKWTNKLKVYDAARNAIYYERCKRDFNVPQAMQYQFR